TPQLGGVVACRGVGVAVDPAVTVVGMARVPVPPLPPRPPVWRVGDQDVGGQPLGDLGAVAGVERDVIVAPVGGGTRASPSGGQGGGAVSGSPLHGSSSGGSSSGGSSGGGGDGAVGVGVAADVAGVGVTVTVRVASGRRVRRG